MANKEHELFDSDIRGKKGKSAKIKIGGSRKEQITNDSKKVQAVVKVTSFRHGIKQVLESGEYISTRKEEGDIGIENQNGEFIIDPDEIREELKAWAEDFDDSKKSRDVVNIVLSAPEGSNLDATTNASREFAREHFNGNHNYAFSVHNDKDHPHVHLMVAMRGNDGTKLMLKKKELHQMRELFAEKLTEQGIEATASYRSERGETHKSEKQWKAQMKKDNRIPNNIKKGVKEVISEIHKEGSYKPREYEKKIAKNSYKVKLEYLDVAKQLKQEGNLEAAKQVEEALKKMPKPLTENRKTAIKYELQQSKVKVSAGADNRTKSSDKDIER